MNTFRAGADVTVFADPMEVPGLGFLPVNAFVLHAKEPVVVDTGLSLPDRDYVATLSAVIDPATVRWIWLTHPDRDHTGGLFKLLEAAPQARLVTTFMAAGIMSTERPLPLHRLHLLNPGQSLDVGDRTLHAFRPPLYDSPATVGFYDDRSHTCFSSDCYGAPLPTAELAGGPDVREVPSDQLRAAQLLWAAVDSPWVHNVDHGALHEDGAHHQRRRLLHRPEHAPAAGDRPRRAARGDARRGAERRSIRRPGPGGARGDAGLLPAGGSGDLIGPLGLAPTYSSGASQTTPSGGTVISADCSKPCQLIGSVSTRPRLPTPLPP